MAEQQARIVISAQDKTRAAFDQVDGSLKSLSNTAGATLALLGTFGAGISVAGVLALTKSTLDAIDALNDWKDATGASIENLSALEDVGLRTGVSMDIIGAALVKFNKVLSEPNPDSPMAKAIERIGLNAADLKKEDPAEALRKVAVALAGYADDGEKARLVQELFGKSVREVAPFLKDLADQQVLQAKATTQQAEEAEKLNKQLFEMNANVEQLKRSILGGLVPAFNELIGRSKVANDVFGGFWGTLAAGAGGDLRRKDAMAGLAEFSAQLAKLDEQIAKIQSGKEPSTGLFGTDRLANLQKQRDELAKIVGYYTEVARQESGLNNTSRGAGVGVMDKPSLGAGIDSRRAVNAAWADKEAVARAMREFEKPAKQFVDQYDQLIQRIREKMKVEAEEAQLGRDLTQAERERFTLLGSLEGITQKDTNGQREKIRALVEGLFVNQKANEQRKEALKIAQELQRQRDSDAAAATEELDRARARNEALADELAAVGLSAQAVAELAAARQQHAIALEEERLVTLEMFARSPEELEALREKIALMKEQAGLVDKITRRTQAQKEDPFLGAKAALDDYLKYLEERGDRVGESLRGIAEGLSDNLLDFFTTGKAGWSDYVQYVLREAVKLMVVQPLMQSLAGFAAGSLGASSFSGVGTQAAGTSMGAIGTSGGRSLVLADSAKPVSTQTGSTTGALVIDKQVNNFGSNVSRAEVLQAQRQGNAELEYKIMRSRRTGGPL